MLTDVGPVELWATRQRRPSAAANPQGLGNARVIKPSMVSAPQIDQHQLARTAMLTSLIDIAPAAHRRGADQMRQQLSVGEHFCRGNAARQ